MLRLRWEQIDREEGAVRIEPGIGKNKEGRLIYLPRELRALLVQQWEDRQIHSPTCPWGFHDHGNRIVNYYKRWHRACREAGILGKIPHDLKRTAVGNRMWAEIFESVPELPLPVLS